MPEQAKQRYVPALRMKKGELQGILGLTEEVKAMTLPHWIVPPRIEREEELQQVLMAVESVPGAGIVLSHYWTDRPALLDLRYLFEEFGETGSALWLPKAHELARRARVPVIPVASVEDLAGPHAGGFKDSVGTGNLRFALRVAAVDFIEVGLKDRLLRAIERVGVTPEETAVLIEFPDTDFSQPELVGGVFESAIEALEEAARWYAIVCQATSYPEKNPATHGGEILVPRVEWNAWVSAVGFQRGHRRPSAVRRLRSGLRAHEVWQEQRAGDPPLSLHDA